MDKLIYFYRNTIFLFRTSKDFWYFFTDKGESIGMSESNFDSAQRMLDKMFFDTLLGENKTL